MLLSTMIRTELRSFVEVKEFKEGGKYTRGLCMNRGRVQVDGEIVEIDL